MSTYNIYVTGDSSHPAGFPMDKNVASHIPTNCDLLVYVGDVYPQGVRYCYEVGTNITSATRTAGFDFAFGERSGHNLVPKMCMLPGNHEYEDAPEGPNAAGVYPVPLTAVGGAHSGDLATLASVGHDYYWTRAAGTTTLQASGALGSYVTTLSNVYPSGSMTPINNTTFNGGSTPAVYNGVTQGRHDCYFDIGGVRFVIIDDSQYTGSITAGAGGGGGDEAFMPLSNGTAAQQARWNKLTGWVDGATGNACIVFAHRTRYPTGNANGNHVPSKLLGPFHSYCTGRIIAWVHGHWHNASRTAPIKAGSNPTSLTAAANTSAFSGAGTTASPRVITNNDGFPIFCQGNGGNSLNGFTQQYASLGQVPDAMREYGDAANYGYMHIHYDTNGQITFDQYNCGQSAAGAATTNTLAAGVTYKTTATVTPPTTPNPPVLVTTPGDPDTDTTPTFAWTAADAITASYQYKVDGAAWPGTGTTLTTATLGALSASASPGTSHTFYVRAVAADGTTVSSQTSYTWHVTTTTTSAPTSFACSLGATGATTTSSTASFSWASGGADDVSYQYSLDGGAWTSNGASLTKTFSTISVSSHTFQVRALNSTNVPSTAVPGTPYAWTVNTNPPPTGQVLFGQSHSTGAPPSFDRTTLSNAEGALSRQIYLAHTIYNWGDNPPTVSTSDEKWLLDRGSFPVINCLGRLNPASVGQDFPNFTNPGTVNDTGLTAIANGTYDAHIKAWAQFSKDLGSDHFTRIWREMTNGAGACVWKTSTGPIFIAAWKRLYTIYKASSYTDYNTNVNPSHQISGSPINASNALMIWCPAVWGDVWDAWYPGDAYVDWIGTDGYSYDTTATASNSNGPQGGWHSFHDIFSNWYAEFNPSNGTVSKAKPIIICEVNAEPSTNTAHNRAAWWTAAEASIRQDFPLVSGSVTWVDSQFPDFGVAGSSEYVAYANDAVMGATTIAGTGGGGGSVVTLTVTNPPSDITVTDTDAYTLAGTASGGAGLALTINGASVALTTGSDQSFTDTFGRTTSGGMGGTWTASGNTSVQSTNGSAGLFTALPANGTSRNVAGAVIADADIYMSESLSTLPVTGAYQHHTLFRWISANQAYHLVTWQDATAGSPVKMVINRVVGGVTTGIPSSSTTAVAPGVATAGTVVWRRVKYVGNHIQAKVWTGAKSAEPGGLGSNTNWTVDVTDTDPSAITASGDVGFSVFRAAAETANPTMTVDNWALTDLSAASGGGSSTFSSAVTLSRGANVYNFVATDTSGASATTIRTITYTPTGGGGSQLPADTDTGTLYQTLDCQIYTVANSQAVSTADWQAVADTYAVVVENPPGARLYPYADDIQTRTPTIWLGTYNKGTGIPTSVTGLPEAWYAHSVARSNSTWGATTRVHLTGSSAHWMAQPDGTGNWTDTSGTVGAAGHVYGSWKEYHAAEVASDLAAVNARYPAGADPYGALFLDSLGVGNFNGQVDPATGTAYSSTPLVWYGLINQAVTYISTADTGDLVETNGADTNTGLAAVSDVAMIEGFMFNGAFNTPTTRLTPSAFAAICNKAIATQAAGAYVSLLDKTWDSATTTGWTNVTNTQLRDAAQLIRGAYHLVNQGKCLIEWSTQASNAGVAKPWAANRTAYWTLDLGAPRDTQTSLSGYVVATNVGTNGGSVYRRRFLRGVVYVNTGNQPLAVQLDRADYHEATSSTLLTSPYTVPAQGAAILTADQNPTGGVIRVSTTPAVTGTAQAGATLTTTAGSWSDGTQIITPTSIAYAWQSALDDGLGGVLLPWATISGATSTTYIAQNGDVGSHIRSSVTAFDSGGNRATAASQPTAIIIAASTPPPTVTAAPVVSPGGASPQVGDLLTSTAGTFSGATSQTIRWQRGDTTTGAWANITSATTTTYTVQNADIGFALRTVATGTNSGGSISTTSQPTLVVTGVIAAPQNITPPTITGNPVVGETLVGDAGQWTGDNLTYTYQWQRQ